MIPVKLLRIARRRQGHNASPPAGSWPDLFGSDAIEAAANEALARCEALALARAAIADEQRPGGACAGPARVDQIGRAHV